VVVLPSLAVPRRVPGQPMSGKLLPFPGKRKVAISKLATSRARDVAQAAIRLPYVRLLQCRTADTPQIDYVIVELEIELPQYPVNDIRRFEVCAIAFPSGAGASPEVLALREDFPQVPHLNLREQEFPRSLCVHEDALAETGFKWSPIRFVEDIRGWLARTARDELHRPDQALEPLMEAGAPELVVPNGLLKSAKSGDHLFLQHGYFTGNVNSLIIRELVTSATSASMFAVYLVGNVQTHGLIRKKPANLAELQEFLLPGGIDVISACQEALRKYLDLGGRSGEQTNMAILVDLPKARYKGGAEEWRDRLAFITHAAVDELSMALGISVKTGQHVVRLIGSTGNVNAEQLPVLPFRRLETLSPEAASQLNGTPNSSSEMLFVGVGALGSHVFINLLRAGFGRWTLLDKDIKLPHNEARHALPGFIGEPKAIAMANLAKAIFPDDQTQAIVEDVLHARDEDLTPKAIKNAELIVDCAAVVAVSRKLASNNDGGRRVSVFLNPSGHDLVLLGEPKDRKIRLDQLEMMYYRELLRNKELAGHLFRQGAPIRYANACRDRSVVIPQDLVALHSGIASSAIKTFSIGDGPQIRIWRADENLNVRHFNIEAGEPLVSDTSGWRILTDEFVFRQLREWRAVRLPNETGGILFGSFDMEQKIIYVADGLPSPSNSTEWPTVYIRGTAGLSSSRAEVDAITQGGLEYVGEWHSHPDGYSAAPSKDDLAALKTLSGVMSEDARPAVMFIIAKKDCRILIA
jgi:proteasome lid subunit RPN8/RPN11